MEPADRDCMGEGRRGEDRTPGPKRRWFVLPARWSMVGYRTPILSLFIGGVLLALAIDACAWAFLAQQRSRTLLAAEREIDGLATVLARQIERDFQTLEFVENGLIDQFRAMQIDTPEDFGRMLSRPLIHDLLREKAGNLPHVGSITLVDAAGKVINFSRFWPIPQIDVTDRDFFTELKADPDKNSFISSPLLNRATGSIVMHVAQRMKGRGWDFIGLVTGAVDLPHFGEFFKSLSPRPGIAIALHRRDGMLLVRHPQGDTKIGETHRLAGMFAKDPASIETARQFTSAGGVDQLVSVHGLGKYPIIIVAT